MGILNGVIGREDSGSVTAVLGFSLTAVKSSISGRNGNVLP